jgi:hypothetical protein
MRKFVWGVSGQHFIPDPQVGPGIFSRIKNIRPALTLGV